MSTTYILGTGRRKTAVARVRLRPGTGEFVVNGRKLDEYFDTDNHRNRSIAPMVSTNTRNKFDVFVKVHGGGNTGQCGAVAHGIARALVSFDANLKPSLYQEGHMTRDPRMVERKKYGRRGARRSRQFSKR